MKMKSTPTYRRLSLAALAFFALPLLPLAAATPTARNLPALMPSPESALQHAAEIELTTEQRAKLEDGMADLQTVVAKFTTEVQRESDALAQTLAAEKPEESEVTSQFERLLAAEAEVKRTRLAMSLRTRAVLTAAQLHKLESSQNTRAARRTSAPADQELATKMERVKGLIERARQNGVDLSSVREMWRRVNELTQEGKASEAGQVLDEAAKGIESKLSTSPSTPAPPSTPVRR